jgi:hypothetical protein
MELYRERGEAAAAAAEAELLPEVEYGVGEVEEGVGERER